MKPKTHLILNILLGLALLALGMKFVLAKDYTHALFDFVIVAMNANRGYENWQLMGRHW